MASFPLHWHYIGPVPPSPVVVSVVPRYYADLPTPPSTPRPPSSPSLGDQHAPCPATPHVVPSATPWHPPNDADARPVPSWTDSATTDQDDPRSPHVSDALIYADDFFAYPSPILAINERALCDQRGLIGHHIDPRRCGRPFKFFSTTAGVVPLTGFDELDSQTLDYYFCVDPIARMPPESAAAYTFSTSAILALRRDLRTLWHAVYPEPIPPVVIRTGDLVAPTMRRRADGSACIVPDEHSIWDTVCRRGVDAHFRPVDPTITVETELSRMGDALYCPQHIAASKFAVNVFMELPGSDRCEYLGAYVLQLANIATVDEAAWAETDPKVRKSVFERVPYLFDGYGFPILPHVKFCYYHWDPCIVQLAIQTLNVHHEVDT